MKKRRKDKDDDANKDVVIESGSKGLRKKTQKQDTVHGVDGKKNKKSSKAERDAEAESKSVPSNDVHLDSLQSIFANKDDADGVFTLFGGDPLSELNPEESLPLTISAPIIQTQQIESKPLYFFPHYDSPQKNTQSLFPVSDESFYHHLIE